MAGMRTWVTTVHVFQSCTVHSALFQIVSVVSGNYFSGGEEA